MHDVREYGLLTLKVDHEAIIGSVNHDNTTTTPHTSRLSFTEHSINRHQEGFKNSDDGVVRCSSPTFRIHVLFKTHSYGRSEISEWG